MNWQLFWKLTELLGFEDLFLFFGHIQYYSKLKCFGFLDKTSKWNK